MNHRYYDVLDKIELIEAVDARFGKIGSVSFYRKVAEILSKIASKNPPWTWRYVQGYIKGTIQPGRNFIAAVNKSIEISRENRMKQVAPKIGQPGWEEFYSRKLRSRKWKIKY